MAILDKSHTADRQVRFIFADKVVAVELGDDTTLEGIAAAWHYLTLDASEAPLGIAVTFPQAGQSTRR
jgi:hypothetical protein